MNHFLRIKCRGNAAGLVLLLALVGGCRPSPIKVSGTVTLNDEPVPAGHILLVPVDQNLAVTSGNITDGEFQMETTAGKKKVEIRASRFVPEIKSSMGPIFREYIPPVYNSQTTLTMEVDPQKENRFTFSLTFP